MDEKAEHYRKLLEEKLVIGNPVLNKYLLKGIPEAEILVLLGSSLYNTGVFQGDLHNKGKTFLYLTFARDIETEIQFILYELTEKGKNFDPNEILSFSAYCADQIKLSKDDYMNLSKEFIKKMSFLGYMERMQ